MDTNTILVLAGVGTALLLIIIFATNLKAKAEHAKNFDALKQFLDQAGYKLETPENSRLEWQFQTTDWLIYYDTDRGAETPSPQLHLTAKTPLPTSLEFAAVCNQARKTLKSGTSRSLIGVLSSELTYNSFVKTHIKLQDLYDLLDRDYHSPLGKNEKPYIHLFANSTEALNAINASQIPTLSDQMNSNETRSSFDNTPHILKIGDRLEISVHGAHPKPEQIQAMIALYETVKKLG